MDVKLSGVDDYIYRKAKKEQKKIGALETVEEQIRFLLAMGKGNEDHFIENSIEELEQTGTMLPELIDAWKRGDEDKLSTLFLDRMKKNYPKLYQSLLVERNEDWLPKIEKHLRTPQKELILVGAGHLVGKDGIVQKLKRRGYRITKMQ